MKDRLLYNAVFQYAVKKYFKFFIKLRREEEMKKIKTRLFFTLFTSMIYVSSLLAQLSDPNMLKLFSDKNLGGESIIKNSKLSVDGEISSKTFEINVPVKGEYYLNAWVMGSNGKNGLENINVILNGRKESIGKLNITKTNWQSASLVDNLGKGVTQKISLEAGSNEITFSMKVPNVPSIEFIRLAKDEKGALISGRHDIIGILIH